MRYGEEPIELSDNYYVDATTLELHKYDRLSGKDEVRLRDAWMNPRAVDLCQAEKKKLLNERGETLDDLSKNDLYGLLSNREEFVGLLEKECEWLSSLLVTEYGKILGIVNSKSYTHPSKLLQNREVFTERMDAITVIQEQLADAEDILMFAKDELQKVEERYESRFG